MSFIISTLFYCKKDKKDLVPYIYVNFTIFLNDPNFYQLQAIGNSVTVTGGVSGIVIFRKSQDEFVAIERCCSYQPSDRCAVEKDSTNQALVCPCCSSKFSIYDASVIKTPSTRPLTLYHAEYNSANSTVRISN